MSASLLTLCLRPSFLGKHILTALSPAPPAAPDHFLPSHAARNKIPVRAYLGSISSSRRTLSHLGLFLLPIVVDRIKQTILLPVYVRHGHTCTCVKVFEFAID